MVEQSHPWPPAHMGPYKVLACKAKFFKMEICGRQETVSVDRLKPHLELTPVATATLPVLGLDSGNYAGIQLMTADESWHPCLRGGGGGPVAGQKLYIY